ncbi:MAG: hypothetical protein ACRYFS_22905 [Janthinobacterium lividum]
METPPELSVHDNNLHSYCVDADKKEICFHTSYEYPTYREYTDIVFTEVAAYHFESDSFGTIIFDINETNVESIYSDNRDLFEDGQKYCWPGTWNRSDDSVLTYLIENEIKGYQLSASLGMVGWVMAKSMKFVSVEKLDNIT